MKRFEVTYKRRLNDNMVWLKIYAPLVARKARPGQFIILRTDEFGERIPLTMAGHNEEDGTIDLIYWKNNYADGSAGSRRLFRRHRRASW